MHLSIFLLVLEWPAWQCMQAAWWPCLILSCDHVGGLGDQSVLLYTTHFRPCVLYTVHSVLYTVYCTQCTVYRVLFTVSSVLFTVYSVLCTVYNVHVYNVQCTQIVTTWGGWWINQFFCTLHTSDLVVYCTQCCSKCTVYCTQFAVYGTQFAVYGTQCTVYCTQCTMFMYTMYSVHK